MVRIIVFSLNDLLSLICVDRLCFVFGILVEIQRSPTIRPSIFCSGSEEGSRDLAFCRCMHLIFDGTVHCVSLAMLFHFEPEVIFSYCLIHTLVSWMAL